MFFHVAVKLKLRAFDLNNHLCFGLSKRVGAEMYLIHEPCCLEMKSMEANYKQPGYCETFAIMKIW